MARVGIYDQIKTAFQDLVAPAIHELREDIRVLDERFTALDAKLEQKVGALDAKVEQKISALDAKVEQRFATLDAKLGAGVAMLDEKIAALDAKVDHKITMVEIKVDSFRAEVMSMKNELISEIRRVDTRIDGLDRELRLALDVRERLAALEARRLP
jgi:ABC-type phosphate transport system auxiliary subunit